jgi:hypothetical protein
MIMRFGARARELTQMNARKLVSPLIGPLAAAALWWAPGLALAAFQTDFTFDPFNPDLFVDNLSFSYTYTSTDETSILSVTGGGAGGSFTDVDGLSTNIASMSFTLTANFSNQGNILTGGNFSISSTDATLPLGIPSGSLLLGGSLFDFSIDPLNVGDTSGTFFFRTNNLSSGVSDILGWDVSANGQIILNAAFDGPYSGWQSGSIDFSDGLGFSTSDTSVPAPSPATIALLAAGLIALRFAPRGRA